ncbi:hypothetical protein Tco_0144277 [Tanacetum coccineum]
MPMTWSPDVTLVSVKEKFCNVMKCLKIPSKFAKSLTCGASISWGRSRLHEGTNTYSWRSTICQNRLKRKRSPPTTPELFANFLNLSSPDSVTPSCYHKWIRGTIFAMDHFCKGPAKYKYSRLSTAYHPQTSGQVELVYEKACHLPNILPTHPALQLDFNFIPSLNDLGSDLDVSSPSGDSNKIYDLGICIEVEATRFCSTLSPVIDTLLTFSFENEDKVFNHGVLASKEKSPSSPSHRGLKAFQLSPESPMLIHGDNTPDLGLSRIFEASRARGFCPSITRASHPQLHLGIRYPNLID